MNIQLVSNQLNKYQEYYNLIESNLLFVTCSQASQIIENQDVLIFFPDQSFRLKKEFLENIKKERVVAIFISENTTEAERCEFLNNGIDVLWEFPMSKKELLAHLKALLRLVERTQFPEVLTFNEGELLLQMATKQVYVEGQEVLLTASEYQLLLQFMQHPNRIYSRDDLLLLLNNHRGTHRAIDTHIKNLRRKIELKQRTHEYIRTIHGRGYRFESEINEREGW